MSRLPERNPILKTKQNVQEKLNKIVEEKCLIFECIEDIISKAKAAVENIMSENDKMKFLSAYRPVNRYLENCSEKLLEVHIILSDKGENDSDDNSSNIKASASSISIEDTENINNDYKTIPFFQSKISDANVQLVSQVDPLPDTGEPNTGLRSPNIAVDSVKTTLSSIMTNENLIDLYSHNKSYAASASIHNTMDASINKDDSAKLAAKVSNCFSSTSSYHSFSSLSSSPYPSKKDGYQPIDLCQHLSRSESVAESITSKHTINNSLVNTDSRRINITPPRYTQTSSSDENSSNKDGYQPIDLCQHLSRSESIAESITLKHTVNNSLVNTDSRRINITPPRYTQNSSSDENSKPIVSRNKVDDNSLINASCSRTDISPLRYLHKSSDESFKPVVSRHKTDNKSVVDTNCCRMDMSPRRYSQNSFSGEDSMSPVSRPKTGGNSLINISCSRTDTSSNYPQNFSDENSKGHSPLSVFDGKENGFEFCVKRNSPKLTSTGSLDSHKTSAESSNSCKTSTRSSDFHKTSTGSSDLHESGSSDSHKTGSSNSYKTGSSGSCETGLSDLHIIPPYQIEVAVNMTFVENPLNFWLQPNKQQFQELLSQLQSVQVNDSPACLIKERHYLAPYGNDNGWHRVKLLQEPSPDDSAAVHYIDYGNKESISTVSLKSLPASLNSFPAQAVHCYLKGVKQDERETSLFVKLFEQPSSSYSLFAIFSPPLSEKYPVELIIKSVTSPYSLNVVQHICNHRKESCKSLTETNGKEVCHQSKEIAENDEVDDYLFASAINEEVKVEEGATCSAGEEMFQDEKEFHNSDSSAFFNSWPEKRKVNFTSASECSSFTSHSSSVTSWKNEKDRLYEEEDCEIKVPEPEITLLQNNSVPVMVAVIVNPKEFYVHIASEKTYQLDDLAEQLNIYYNKTYKRTSIKTLRVGGYCACKFAADQCWYRAVILDIFEDSNKLLEKNTLAVVEVQYIDYGNKECISSKELHPLPLFLTHLPAFAVKCALANLQPPFQENGNLENRWPQKTIARFKELTGFEKCFTAQFISPLDCQSAREVILWDSEETSVNDILIQEDLAMKDFDSEEYERSKSDYGSIDGLANGWNPMADDYLNEQNMYEVDLDDPEIAFTGYKTKDETFICKFFSRGDRCHRGEKCPYKHIKSEGLTLDQEEVFSYDLSIDLPEVGTCVLAQVSAVFNPTHFYMIFPYGTVPVDDTNILAYSVRENLDKFVKSMSMYYNTTKVKKSITAQALGKIVAAKSRFDNQWYRARIQDTNSADKLTKVFYVDFGNCEWVSHCDMEEIDTKFMDFPFQAAECRLANVQIKKTAKSELKTLSWELFQKFTENKIVLAHIVGHDQSVLLVKLHCVTATNDISINDELVVRGLAFPED